ncbi:MAG: hypothetical protein LDL41_08180 [Coleofasciculus sp. S288]|nr:hypothetical protein [Coleofasciculus sp. S288]
MSYQMWCLCVSPKTAIPPWVILSQDGMGVLSFPYSDMFASTTFDRSEEDFSPLVGSNKVEEAAETPHRNVIC